MLRAIRFAGLILVGASLAAPAGAHCPKQGCPPPAQQPAYQPPPRQQPAQPRQAPVQYQNPQRQYPQRQYQPPQQSPAHFRRPDNPPDQGGPGRFRQPNTQPLRNTSRPDTARANPFHPQLVPFAPRAVHIDRQTTATGLSDGRGFAVERKNPDGSQIFAKWHVAPNGNREIEAYRQSNDLRAGTQTKIYVDGRRVVTGRDFETVSAPGRLSVTTYQDGARTAKLRNGQVVYKERLDTLQGRDGHPQPVVVRTIYDRVHAGRAYSLRAPVEETYQVGYSGGERLYAYIPPTAPDGYYDVFMARLPDGVALPAICPSCAGDGVEMSRGWFSSDTVNDPAQLVADMQLSNDLGTQPAQDEEDVGPDDASNAVDQSLPIDDAASDPEVSELQGQIAQLQQQVGSAEAANQDLKNQLADQETETALLHSQSAAQALNSPPAQRTKVKVPHDVEKQMTKQVHGALNHLKNQQALSLPDVIASAQALDYIFTVASKMNAARDGAPGTCLLSKGDMIKVASVPADADKLIRMEVVISKPGSCAKGKIVDIGKADAQEMLNAFSKEVQASVADVQEKIAALAKQSKHG